MKENKTKSKADEDLHMKSSALRGNAYTIQLSIGKHRHGMAILLEKIEREQASVYNSNNNNKISRT